MVAAAGAKSSLAMETALPGTQSPPWWVRVHVPPAAGAVVLVPPQCHPALPAGAVPVQQEPVVKPP